MWNHIIVGITLIAALLAILFYSRQIYLSREQPLAQSYIQALARQAARWAIAAQNDQNKIIATLHANYAAGYLWSLFDICTPRQFENAVGVSYLDFKQGITSVQDQATRSLAASCPAIAPEPSVLAYVAGEGLIQE